MKNVIKHIVGLLNLVIFYFCSVILLVTFVFSNSNKIIIYIPNVITIESPVIELLLLTVSIYLCYNTINAQNKIWYIIGTAINSSIGYIVIKLAVCHILLVKNYKSSIVAFKHVVILKKWTIEEKIELIYKFTKENSEILLYKKKEIYDLIKQSKTYPIEYIHTILLNIKEQSIILHENVPTDNIVSYGSLFAIAVISIIIAILL